MDRKFYIKVITGFREDQETSIPIQEAHKAYYLFKNPDARGVFDCGVALVGRNIQEIKPDYNKTMGWLDTHELDADDWKEIRKLRVEEKMRWLIEKAKQIGDVIESKPEYMKLPMGEVLQEFKPNEKQQLESEEVKQLANKMSLK